jgi:hypothetical protein
MTGSDGMTRVTAAELDELEASDADHGEIAAAVLAWADDPALEAEPPLTAATLLVAAGEHLLLAGRADEAAAVADRARSHPSAAASQAHPLLVQLALDRGDTDAAAALADEARGAGYDSAVAQQLGERFELAGDLDRAERWYVLGARALETAGADDEQRALLLRDRYRVRRDGRKPADVLDTETEQLLTRLRIPLP